MTSESPSQAPAAASPGRKTRRSTLPPEDRKLITQARTLKPIKLENRELARLVSVALHDLGHTALIPQWVGTIDAGYYQLPLDWFTQDAPHDADDAFDFESFFQRCTGIESFRTIFRCLCELHTRRRKFAWILRNQPLPTMDQVAPRGLLEHGLVGLPSLTSWLTWRKWIYDIDNRSAQETGYLFEPMLAASLGGQTYTATRSPVTREGKPNGGGRQVDCVIDAGSDGTPAAYEFKARMTIAASGQGRFDEELSFPQDCRASGYQPILLVLDPTPSDKLTALIRAFRNAGGEAYVGEAVWEHVREKSGDEITRFVKTYIRDPILEIGRHEASLLGLGLEYLPGRSGAGGDLLRITIGEQAWEIARERPRSAQEEIDDGPEAAAQREED